MKKIIIAMVFVTVGMSEAYSQIPVTDVASITNSTLQQAQTLLRWKMQYDQMVGQIKQMEQQYKSLTGSRNLGDVFNNPLLRDYLPRDWQKIYDEVKYGGYTGLSGTALSIYNSSKIFDGCAHIEDDIQRTSCEARAVKGAQDKGLALDAYGMAKARINQIDQLMGKINATRDPKSIAELQGRIAVEQANITNEQTKLQLYEMVADAEDKLQQQRQREIQARTWAARKGIEVQPIRFGEP